MVVGAVTIFVALTYFGWDVAREYDLLGKKDSVAGNTTINQPPNTIQLSTSTTNSLTPQSSPPTTAIPPQPASTASAAGLGVANFCFCDGPREQAMIKVKPLIKSQVDRTLPIQATNLRLLVPKPLEGDWSPPRGSGTIIEISLPDGKVALAIPPNPDGAAENNGGGQTFATHWDASSLSPTDSYFEPGVKEGDLVFYVPHGGSGDFTLFGLGLIEQVGEDWELQGFIDSENWQGEANGNPF